MIIAGDSLCQAYNDYSHITGRLTEWSRASLYLVYRGESGARVDALARTLAFDMRNQLIKLVKRQRQVRRPSRSIIVGPGGSQAVCP